MKFITKFTCLTFAVWMLCLPLFGCADKPGAGGAGTETPQNTQGGNPPGENPPAEKPYDGPVSALTGLACSAEEASARPAAFAVNNEIQFLPKEGLGVLGLSSADVIFETNLESNGSGTRFLAVYSQNALKNTEKIGGIRSARPYFINLALMMDAYYCHDGESSTDGARGRNGQKLSEKLYARWMLRNTGISRLALQVCNYGKYEASAASKIGVSSRYDTLCALGPEILEAFKKTYPRTTYDDAARRTLFSFGENDMASGKAGESVKVFFSQGNTNYTACDFVYDEESGLYEKGQYVYKNMKTRTVPKDLLNSETLKFKNVFVLCTNQYAYDYEFVDGALKGPYHTQIDLNGYSGRGYYFSDGKYMDIVWKCDDNTDSGIRYYDTDENELSVNPGKSYVALIDTDVADKLSIS